MWKIPLLARRWLAGSAPPSERSLILFAHVTRHAKAVRVMAVGQGVPVAAARGPGVGGMDIGGPAPQHALLSRGWPMRVLHRALRIRAVPVGAPLEHIAVHVV